MSKRVTWSGRVLSIRDTARALEVHENTVRAWIRKGILAAEVLPGSGYRRVPGEEVDRILAGREPSYHDLHITTDEIPRTSIFNLPFGYEVSCNRVAGWSLWMTGSGEATLVAGEYDDKGLRLDINGAVVVDSLADEVES